MDLIKSFKKTSNCGVDMIKEMLFRNLSSMDRKRRIFSSCVVNQGKDYTTTTERKYTYLIKKIGHHYDKTLEAHIFIRKQRDTNKHMQIVNCLLKGSFYACGTDCLFLIRYAHSLEIVRKILTF